MSESQDYKFAVQLLNAKANLNQLSDEPKILQNISKVLHDDLIPGKHELKDTDDHQLQYATIDHMWNEMQLYIPKMSSNDISSFLKKEGRLLKVISEEVRMPQYVIDSYNELFVEYGPDSMLKAHPRGRLGLYNDMINGNYSVDSVRHRMEHLPKTPVCLFEHYEMQPKALQRICEKYEELYLNGEADYPETAKFCQDVEGIGYTFDFYLDNLPYALRKIEIPLNQVKGFEDSLPTPKKVPTQEGINDENITNKLGRTYEKNETKDVHDNLNNPEISIVMKQNETKKKPINKDYVRGNLADVPKVLENGNVALTVLVNQSNNGDSKKEPEAFEVIFYGDAAEKAGELAKGDYIETYGKLSVKVNDTEKGRYENETISSGGFKMPESHNDAMEKASTVRAISGRLAADPVFETFPGTDKNGDAVENQIAKYTVMQNQDYTDKQGKEVKRKPLAINYVAFGKEVTALQSENLKKGDLILAKGTPKTNKYSNDDGKKFQSRSVVQSEVKVLFRKEQSQEKAAEEAPKAKATKAASAKPKAKKKSSGVSM